ncbi:hypothetical protein BASA81_009860 [Batrachochytrium salamandrivorans]|nr:hypothetical protein BASA81_009860 [Batrachochytrium salamandrivorans]
MEYAPPLPPPPTVSRSTSSSFLDPSDFPLLRPTAPPSASSTSSGLPGNPLPMSIVVGGQQPKIYAENFPALPGATTTASSSSSSSRAIGSSSSAPQPQQAQAQSSATNPFIMFAQQSQQKPLASAASQPPVHQHSLLPKPAPQSHSVALAGLHQELNNNDPYGLMGLMGVIRMKDPDRGKLALGMDLTTLGLDLNSDECLYNVFQGPWDDDVANPDSATTTSTAPVLFHLPTYYPKTSNQVRHELFKDLSLDCLFAIFYSVIRDVLQLYAAVELSKRKWYFHIELKIWFTSQTSTTTTTSSNKSTGNNIMFFDLGTWERKFYVGTRFQNGFLPENGFLAEDTIQLAFKQAQASMKPARAWS